MPTRKDTFKNGNYYHVFDKTIDRRKIFATQKLCRIFTNAVEFYSFSGHRVSFSKYRLMPPSIRDTYNKDFYISSNTQVRVVSYTLMPNHYHFLLLQSSSGGIQRFIGNLINSFTRYYNTLYSRKGPLFLPRFRSVSVLSKQQLLYTSKYIHLNPVKAKMVRNVDELVRYPWSSYGAYMRIDNPSFVNCNKVLKHFNYSPREYKRYLIGNDSTD